MLSIMRSWLDFEI